MYMYSIFLKFRKKTMLFFCMSVTNRCLHRTSRTNGRNRIRARKRLFSGIGFSRSLTKLVRDHVGISLYGLLRILQGVLLRRQLAEFCRFLVPWLRYALPSYSDHHDQDDENQSHQSAHHYAYQRR